MEDNSYYERDDFQADPYEDEKDDPYNVGYQAGMKGEERESGNSIDGVEWIRGWQDGEDDRRDREKAQRLRD